MSRHLLPLSASALLLCGTALAEAPSVAVDIAPVHSLVARVMDGVGTPDLIIQPGASPHSYNLRPSEAAALENADLVFWVGEDLTPWLENAIDTLSANASVTALLDAEGTTLLDFRENALFEAHDHDEHGHDDHDHDEHGHDDHGDEEHAKADDHDDHDEHGHDDHDHDEHGHDDHGDEEHAKADDHDDHDEHGHDDHDHDEHGHDEHGHDDHGDEEHAKADDHDDHDEHGHDEHGHDDHGHGDHDPHAWLSPDNAAAWLNVIAAQLSAADPDNAGTYFANASAAREDLDDLKTELSGLLEPARGKNFIVFHDAYQYFESDFDFPAAGAISLGDATDPSPARVAEIQQRVQSEGIDCVLAEPQFNPSLVQTVLDGTDANTGVLDPLGSDLTPGQDLYPQLLRNLAQALADCL